MPKNTGSKKGGRDVYPLDISNLAPLIAAAQKETGIKNKAELLRQGVSLGLPELMRRLPKFKTAAAQAGARS